MEKRTEQKANNDKSPRSREDWWGSSICLAVGLVACSRTMIEAELFSQRGLLGTSAWWATATAVIGTPQIHHRERSGLRTVVLVRELLAEESAGRSTT